MNEKNFPKLRKILQVFKMVFDTKNIFDTPRIKYYKLKEEFESKYLDPKAWDYEFDTKEIIQAYQDLLDYFEETEQLCDLSHSLSTDIPTDNINLVLGDLPFTPKRREELIEFIVSDNSSELTQEEELNKIKKFFEMKKKGSLVGFERRYRSEQEYRRVSLLEKGNLYEKNIKNEVENDVKFEELSRRSLELFEIRQSVYAKLRQGKNVDSMLRKFKRKVGMYLKKNRKDISYDEAVNWRTKVTITEKAVATYKRKFLSEKDHDRIVPDVREIFDEAKAQEMTIENIPEPPQEDDEIEKKLEELREFNKRLLDDKNSKTVGKKIKEKVKIHEGKIKVATDKIEDDKKFNNIFMLKAMMSRL